MRARAITAAACAAAAWSIGLWPLMAFFTLLAIAWSSGGCVLRFGPEVPDFVGGEPSFLPADAADHTGATAPAGIRDGLFDVRLLREPVGALSEAAF